MNGFYNEILKNFLDEHVIFMYIIFFLVALFQMLFPPIPGDFLLVLQGYITCINNKYTICMLFLNSSIASIIGSVIVYKFGFINGDKVFKYKLINKYIKKKQKIKVKKLFKKFGLIAIILSKFLLGINAIVILFSGIFKVRRKVVYSSIIMSNLIHHIILLLLGKSLAKNIKQIEYILKTYNYIIIALTILIGIICLYYYKKHSYDE